MSRFTYGFMALYLLFTLGDAWSTNVILSMEGVQEFNAVMADETGHINNMKFWTLNLLIGLAGAGLLEWAIRHRDQVGQNYLASPIKAAFNFLYLNPFSKRNRPKAILHYTAMALGFILIKPFAIANNLSIGLGGNGFLYGLASWLNQYVEGGLLYSLCVSAIVIPLWIGTLYIVAFILKSESTLITTPLST